MDLKQPRPPRYVVGIAVQIDGQLAGPSISGTTSDVSLAGCYVLSTDSPELKSTVRVQLSYRERL
jgi:hypothetical protein